MKKQKNNKKGVNYVFECDELARLPEIKELERAIKEKEIQLEQARARLLETRREIIKKRLSNLEDKDVIIDWYNEGDDNHHEEWNTTIDEIDEEGIILKEAQPAGQRNVQIKFEEIISVRMYPGNLEQDVFERDLRFDSVDEGRDLDLY
ncbi:MAG: hypothetical protein WCW02_03555 [Candidatus Buchananbacteria bacterium]